MVDVAIGATSLLLQLFGAALEGYKIFRCATCAGVEIKIFVLRLKVEQCRLSRWGELTGLSGSNEAQTFNRHLETQKPWLVDVLKQIKIVLDGLSRLVDFHASASPAELESGADVNIARTLDISGSLDQSSAVQTIYAELTEAETREKSTSTSSKHPRGMNHLFQLAEDVFVVSKEPKRLVWAIRDQRRFRIELEKLRNLTDHLHQAVSDDQMDQLIEWSHQTWLYVLQLSNTVQDMKVLLAAQQETRDHQRNVDSRSDRLESQLHATMEKVTSFAIRTSLLEMRGSMFMGLHNMPGLEQMSEEDDGYRTLATLNGKHIWIEWRSYEVSLVPDQDGIVERIPDPQSVQNVKRLTWLLSQSDQPDEFHLPKSLGYIDDIDELRFGVILDPMAEGSRSLLSLFSAPRIGPLGQYAIARQIAESLLYLHAVNWLHKGLRSAGIVFGQTASESVGGLGHLFVSGFGFSRPSDHSFTTSGPPHDDKWLLYCHPDYLDQGRKAGYRKSYDIYSLGIILIEVAHWKPIDQILQPSHSGRDSALGEQRQDIRVRILDGGVVLEQVRQNMGDRYANATRACIEGVTAFGLQSGIDESNPYVAALLQQAFIDVVIDPLKGIVV
ncbi:hypothetical protein D6C78_02171 [Aureobasidium pullulans]|uniref:Protein kinase domain-containing protein n=1 Tax=Aureobasidium pullulans TaxID=5580 RepID=A0A4T0C0N9_AURPU|nr:hypothetical protein D6C78_02171 [Aureobasidium pullulans]